jgi:uncharacterized membrane protein
MKLKKYFLYLIIYSIGGFILERIINIIAYNEYLDNSILIGPYQPLYGSGVVIALIIYDLLISKKITNKLLMNISLLITAIATTAIVEAITGYGFEFLYGNILWDYSEFLPCNLYYVCWLPTSLFGIVSYLIIKYLHPIIESYIKVIPTYLVYALFVVFGVDILVTFFFIL